MSLDTIPCFAARCLARAAQTRLSRARCRSLQVVQVMCVARRFGPMYAMYTCLALLRHAGTACGELGCGDVGIEVPSEGAFDMAQSLSYIHELHARYGDFCKQSLAK